MKDVNILITGAGAPGISGTIYALRNNPNNRKFRIITCDTEKDAVGQYLSDKFYTVAHGNDDGYIPTIRSIVEANDVDVVIPQTTPELFALSKHDVGTKVTISSEEAIRIANDKVNILECVGAMKLNCFPKYEQATCEVSVLEAAKWCGFPEHPVIIKPKWSSGMRGFRIVTEDGIPFEEFLTSKPEESGKKIEMEELLWLLERRPITRQETKFLVMEYLPGIEYSVDCFRGKNSFVAIPRRRNKIRSGISFDTTVELRSDLIDICKKLAERIDLKYAFGFQFKLDWDGVPKLIECNPRVQGTMVASCFAGFNIIYASVKEALGEEVNIDYTYLKDGVNFRRYWGGICNGKTI